MDAFTLEEERFNSLLHVFSQEDDPAMELFSQVEETDESLGLFSEVEDRGQRLAEDSSPALTSDVKLADQILHDPASADVGDVRHAGLLRTNGGRHPVCNFFQGRNRRRQRGREVRGTGTLRIIGHKFKHGMSSNARLADLCRGYGISVASSKFGATTGGNDQGEHKYSEDDDKTGAADGKDIKFDEVDSDAETIDLEFEELQAAKASEVHVQRFYAPDSMPDSVPPGMESYRDFVLKSLMTSYDPKMMKK